MFAFTPLLGAQSASSAVQSLLEFDGGVKVLIDVGWDTGFDAEQLRELERQVPTISVILLTHPTLAHVGAYAHCCKHVPLFSRIPVYATAPVISLGRTLLQDLYASTPLAASLLPASAIVDSSLVASPEPRHDSANILLQRPSNDEIASYFSLINPLKFSQPHQPVATSWSAPLDGLTVTAYSSGHTLGGTIWHLQHGSESVVYAVDWNHARENLLSGAAWLGTGGGGGGGGAQVIEQLRNPTALVCSSKGAEVESLAGGWRKRDELLLSHIRSTVAKGASVLIPCDTSARCLELAYLVERAFLKDAASFKAATPYLVSRTCSATIRYARSMLEWMDESVVREFEAFANERAAAAGNQREGPGLEPFNFEHLKLIDHPGPLSRVLAADGPKIFLANDATLEWGFSKEVLRKLSGDSDNLVVLTENLLTTRAPSTIKSQSPKNQPDEELRETASDTLLDLFRSLSTNDGVAQCSNADVTLQSYETMPLAASDQQYYQQWLARQRERLNAAPVEKASTLETSADVVQDDSDSTSSSEGESDDEHQGKVLNVSSAMTHSKHKLGLTDEELGINVLLRRKNVHDYDVRGKKGREKMFPFVAKRQRRDEYGDVIRPEEYLRAEEKEEVAEQDNKQAGAKMEAAVGQKRRWDARGQGQDSARGDRRVKDQGLATRTKKQISDKSGQQDDASGSEESDYEPDEPVVLGPLKVAFGQEKLSLKLRLATIDYSSIHDKRSLRMLIPLIAPRKVILTGGQPEETDFLARECRKLLSRPGEGQSESAHVFTPLNGTTVDASVDTNAWTVKLGRSLYKNLQWQRFRGLGIVTVNGQIQAAQPDELPEDDGSNAAKRQKLEASTADSTSKEKAKSELPPVLDMIPTALASASRSAAPSLHVGDLRLAELRRILLATGHVAEFKGEGTLLVDGIVAVRKNAIGHIEVESGWSGGAGHGAARAARAGSSFSNVKRKIYEGLAVVAAR